MQHSFIYRKKMRTDFELENDVVTLLKHHDLRLTQVRKEVLSVFLKKEQALSQSDIEENVGQIDRITLYRTLRSFEDNGLILVKRLPGQRSTVEILPVAQGVTKRENTV